ncbi:MAG: phosphoribosylaminoimidazolesuccinocarboxamide synthase, partial [Angustibacter sp.]
RGYLAGTGWDSYRATGAISGIDLPAGLSESARLPEPIFTPSTKAELGDHDELITQPELHERIGEELAGRLAALTLAIFRRGSQIAADRGVIIADTKLEFGHTPTGELVLADEVLTPDSSRFWAAEDYQSGRPQQSLDKQFVRDWARSVPGWQRTEPGPELPPEVVAETRRRYIDIYQRLTGTTWAA